MTTSAAQQFLERTAETPPEPFSELVYGTELVDGDLLLIPASDDPCWEEVPSSHFGLTVSNQVGIRYARLQMPEGYYRITGDDVVGRRAMIWRSGQPRWQGISGESVPPGREGHEMSVVEFEHFYFGEDVYICVPLAAAWDYRSVPIPPIHRELFPGEAIRRGDKFITVDMDDWDIVSERIRGSQVMSPPEEPIHNLQTSDVSKLEFNSTHVRFCRPIHPLAQNWYVALAGGGDDKEGLGSAEKPFATLDGAMARIESAAEAANQKPFGVIWDVSGAPLLAYDIGEPAVGRLGKRMSSSLA